MARIAGKTRKRQRAMCACNDEVCSGALQPVSAERVRFQAHAEKPALGEVMKAALGPLSASKRTLASVLKRPKKDADGADVETNVFDVLDSGDIECR